MRSSTIVRRTARVSRFPDKQKHRNIEHDNGGTKQRQRKKQRRVGLGANQLFWLVVILPLTIVVCLSPFFVLRNGKGPDFLRWTDTSTLASLVQVDLKVTLPTHGRGRLLFPAPIDWSDTNFTTLDFGGLTVTKSKRIISHGPDDKIFENFAPPDDEALQEDYDAYYYRFDDDNLRNPYYGWEDDSVAKDRHCRRAAWHRDSFPNCNEFHATNLPALTLNEGVSLIAGGAYRDVFLLEQQGLDPEIVFKMAEIELDYKTQDYETMRVEGNVFSAIGPHPLVIDLYGFCALSLCTEAMTRGDLEQISIPKYRREKCNEIPQMDGPYLIEMNDLEPGTKLIWAMEMAESVALLHSHERGVIVHDDIQLRQFLVGPEGHLKTGKDFNRAEIMLYDEEHGEYCKYRNGAGRGVWRSPEEYKDEPLDEQIDIWSLGMSFYGMLTGLNPIHDVCSKAEAAKYIKHGGLPFIHPEWKRRSFAEAKLVEIIRDCLAYDPDDRMSINELVNRLRHAVWQNQQRQAQRRPW